MFPIKPKNNEDAGQTFFVSFLPCLLVTPIPTSLPQACLSARCPHTPLIHAGPQPGRDPPFSWTDFPFQNLAQHFLAKSPGARAGGAPVTPQVTQLVLPSLLLPPLILVGTHNPSSPSATGPQLRVACNIRQYYSAPSPL